MALISYNNFIVFFVNSLISLIEFKYETINPIVQELNNYKNPPSIVIPGRTFKNEILIYLSIEFASKKKGNDWKPSDWNYYESLTKKDIEKMYKDRFFS